MALLDVRNKIHLLKSLDSFTEMIRSATYPAPPEFPQRYWLFCHDDFVKFYAPTDEDPTSKTIPKQLMSETHGSGKDSYSAKLKGPLTIRTRFSTRRLVWSRGNGHIVLVLLVQTSRRSRRHSESSLW